MSFSNGGGGTMIVPSPTHVRHGDVSVSSAVRNLRRSLSRSPSKFNLGSSKTTPPNNSDSPNSQTQGNSHSPSPQSPCQRYSPAFTSRPSHEGQKNDYTAAPSSTIPQSTYTPTTHPPSVVVRTECDRQFPSFSTPLRPNVKLSLRSGKSSKATSTTPSRPPVRARASPRSPLKRALSSSSDSGNSAPPSSAVEKQGHENSSNNLAVPTSPLPRRCFDKQSRPHSLHLDVSGTSQSIFRALNMADLPGTPTGALKRSDANMDLDAGHFGSPVAKRRSLHGISSLGHSAQETTMFETAISGSMNFDIHDDSANQEYQLTGSTAASSIRRESQPSPTPNPSMPRRSSSLRKSTLQQRHGDKGSWGRRAGALQLAQLGADVTTPNARSNRPRLSLDQFVPPHVVRDSPFSANGPLPNPSMHIMDRQMNPPHPLSRSLKPSNSGNRLLEDTPMKPPPEPRIRNHSGYEPSHRSFASRSVHMDAAGNVVATPRSNQETGRMFMSTGLVSKMHYNPEDDKKIVVPETPCKKPHGAFGTYPPGSHGSGRLGRDPSSPVAKFADRARDGFGSSAKGLGLFHRLGGGRLPRRGSVLSFDDDKNSTENSQTTTEGEVPPTPTKNLFTPSAATSAKKTTESPSASRRVPLSAVRPDHGGPDRLRESSCKSPSTSPGDAVEGTEKEASCSATNLCSRTSPVSCPSLGQSRIESDLDRLSRLGTRPPTDASVVSAENLLAKFHSPSPASPVLGQYSPKTPQERQEEQKVSPDQNRLTVAKQKEAPVTPTTTNGRRLVTPVHGRGRVELDDYLVHKFSRVEPVGGGEFSTVFKVAYPKQHRSSVGLDFGASLNKTPPGNPPPGKAFAVKKMRRPFLGPRDRETKLREVRILTALRYSTHIIQFVHSWEIDGHLYVQTEYCDDGSLDGFLSKIGRDGRLDDFRIWKILHDISLGLQEIHHHGFIHLDLKPANVFITFEGVLKIGDFGLATEWPAKHGIDAEGDREYMAAEILAGQVDKPADIFALGIILLEMAANVALPENGPSWQALRNSDFHLVPTLTYSTTTDHGGQDPADVPLIFEGGLSGVYKPPQGPRGEFGVPKNSPLLHPPAFMSQATHPSSLDQVVMWLTLANASMRPTVDQVLGMEGLAWVANRRRFGATVYEGMWGPDDAMVMQHSSVGSDGDTVMTDV